MIEDTSSITEFLEEADNDDMSAGQHLPQFFADAKGSRSQALHQKPVKDRSPHQAKVEEFKKRKLHSELTQKRTGSRVGTGLDAGYTKKSPPKKLQSQGF